MNDSALNDDSLNKWRNGCVMGSNQSVCRRSNCNWIDKSSYLCHVRSEFLCELRGILKFHPCNDWILDLATGLGGPFKRVRFVRWLHRLGWANNIAMANRISAPARAQDVPSDEFVISHTRIWHRKKAIAQRKLLLLEPTLPNDDIKPPTSALHPINLALNLTRSKRKMSGRNIRKAHRSGSTPPLSPPANDVLTDGLRAKPGDWADCVSLFGHASGKPSDAHNTAVITN